MPLGIASLLLAAAPAGMLGGVPGADAAAARGALTGDRLLATTDASLAPRVATGTYLTTLRSRPTYVRLGRTAPGTTLHLGAQLVGVGRSTGEGFDVELGTDPGSGDCGSAVVFRPTQSERAPVLYAATSTWTTSVDDPCTADSSVYVTIAPPNDPHDVGRPLQLRVYEEPSVDESAFEMLTTPSPPVWSAPTPGAAQAVTPGHVVDDAPVLTGGTYSVRIEPGESDFLAVPLGWGAGLRVQLDTELPAGVPARDPGIELHLLGPLLDGADTGGLGSDSDIGSSHDRNAWSTGAMVPDISYINRDSVDAAVKGADLAGMHYVALGYRPSLPGASPLDVRLTVQLLPGDGQAPLYGDVRGVLAPEATSRLVDGSLTETTTATAAPAAGSSAVISEPGPPWGRILLVVGVLAVLGLVANGLHEVSLRRRHAREQHHRHLGERPRRHH